MRRARRGNRRTAAVSEIITALILIGASAAFTSIILFWSQSFLSQSTTSYGNRIFISNLAASEQFSIDEVILDNTTTSVFVRNFGDVPVQVAAVYIHDAATGALLNEGDSQLSPIIVILPRTARLITTSPAPATPLIENTTVTIRVASDRGNQIEENFNVE